jgi:hypothetical protein
MSGDSFRKKRDGVLLRLGMGITPQEFYSNFGCCRVGAIAPFAKEALLQKL